MLLRIEPSSQNDFAMAEAQLIMNSYQHYLGQSLSPYTDPKQSSAFLYQAPFAVVAHDTSPDPIFFYANLQAQHLFEMNWVEITALPSRLSAEPVHQDERQALLSRVSEFGFIADYSGVRVSKSGKRFWIKNATVWNLLDAAENKIGQAACFAEWEFLPAKPQG
ncbi:MEKHLA [Burkholderiaceae bacterium]